MEEFSKEENCKNLIFVDEHSDQHLFSCLSNRLNRGQNYTFAGSVLISTTTEAPATTFSKDQQDLYSEDYNSDPHLYSISYKTYKQLKLTSQNQVVTLLGYSGAGKTFAAIHLIDHFCHLSGGQNIFPLIHASIQLLHIMGSVFSPENGESSTCGIITSLLFDQNFNLVKGNFKAKLLDYTLPYSPLGKTYHILHALVTTSKTQLKTLGLSSTPTFKIFSNHVFTTKENLYYGHSFERFYRNLQVLKFTRAEIQEILELFSVVILLFEVHFVGNQFVIAGDKEYTEWTPRHRTAVQKVCKLLLISEEKFLELFQGIQHKSIVDSKIRELARSVYLVVFEWVLSKINSKLSQFSFEELQKKGLKKDEAKSAAMYQVSLVDFPGFHQNSTLGGFCSNLSLESLNLFAADKLIGLLNSLQAEKISMNILPEPHCKDLVTILMSKEFGLLQSLDAENFDRYWKEFRLATKDNKQLVTANVSFVVKYTWGEVEYDLNQLRSEAKRFLHPSEFSYFFSKCSNSLVKKVVTPCGLSLSETLRRDLSVLLEPLVGYENSLVYFLRASKGKLDYNDTIRLFRNTLIMPCLYWEWYGYQHWVSNLKLLNDLGVGERSAGQTHNYLTSLLSEVLPSDDFIVGINFTLFKDSAFQLINSEKTLKFALESRTHATFKAFSPNSPLKKVRAQSSKLLSTNETIFYYSCYGEQPLVSTGIYEFLDSVADIDDMSFKRESLSRLSKISSKSSISSLKDTLQTVHSQKHFKSLQHSLSNFKLLNYSEQLPHIINIQKHWKGFQARKYYKVFLLLKTKARLIQSAWKTFKQREQFKKVQKSVKVIQNAYKRRFRLKTRSAIAIQTWYRQIKYTQNRLEDISSQISSIENTSIPNLIMSQKSLSKSYSKVQQPEETFKPRISKNSRILAKIREDKLGSANLPVEKRLEVLNLLKKNKIDELRKTKIDTERMNIKPSPSINKSHEFSSSFLQRQELKTNQIRMKREKEIVKKQCEESAGLTFKPTLVSKSSKSLERSVKDLHTWAEVKNHQISKAQKKKADEEARSISPFRISIKSKKLIQERQLRLAKQSELANNVKESVLPYWPNKSAQVE